jgi:hypothetical protein
VVRALHQRRSKGPKICKVLALKTQNATALAVKFCVLLIAMIVIVAALLARVRL